MEISISDELWARIQQKVDTGRYPSADAVIARSLALLEERDLADSDPATAAELAGIRAKVMEGIEDLRNGRSTKYESAAQLIADISRMSRELNARESARKEAFVG